MLLCDAREKEHHVKNMNPMTDEVYCICWTLSVLDVKFVLVVGLIERGVKVEG